MQDLNLHELFKLKPIKKDKEQTHRLTQPQENWHFGLKKEKPCNIQKNREIKMSNDKKPPLGSRIRSMLIVYELFGEYYSESQRRSALGIMANLLKEVDENGV